MDESLAWMLQKTRPDIEGRALRLPFPSFAFIFTDRASLEMGEAVMRADSDAPRGAVARSMSVYLTRIPAPGDALGLDVCWMVDHTEGEWPYMVARELYVKPEDDLEGILESRAADLPAEPFFRSEEVKRLVHVVLNAILYATSADGWAVLPSPAAEIRRKAREFGDRKRWRAETRARQVLGTRSGEDVFHLPGRITISQIRRLREIESSREGAEIMARFMVRGHWRRAQEGGKDPRPRWIEPYWKGPDRAAIIEREYRMKV